MIKLISAPCLPFERIEEFREFYTNHLINRKGGFSLAINAEKIIRINGSEEFKNLAWLSTFPIVDGFGAQIASFVIYGKKLVKINLPIETLEAAEKLNLKLFVLGAEEEVNKKSCDFINSSYPNIKLIGRMNGFEFTEGKLIRMIEQLRPEIVLVALGSPKQEYLALKLSAYFPNIIFIGCGGALDVLVGKVKRAPLIIQNSGFEWLYRLLQSPKRIKRQIKLPILFWLILKELMK